MSESNKMSVKTFSDRIIGAVNDAVSANIHPAHILFALEWVKGQLMSQIDKVPDVESPPPKPGENLIVLPRKKL